MIPHVFPRSDIEALAENISCLKVNQAERLPKLHIGLDIKRIKRIKREHNPACKSLEQRVKANMLFS